MDRVTSTKKCGKWHSAPCSLSSYLEFDRGPRISKQIEDIMHEFEIKVKPAFDLNKKRSC